MTTATLTPALIPAPRRPPRPAAAPTPRAALGLLRQAAEGLAEAHRKPEPLMRYPAAYLAALRAAAAVLALRARPAPRRGGSRNVWTLLAHVAPELAEWAAFFASCSATRAAAEAGIERLVSSRDADDLLRQAEQFLELVTDLVEGR
jgi:HEPN domain-containing protein